ncbi:MAG TPA: hypothetical protein PKZ32_14175 [Candidatus Melainabacteria bacterium]|nr:hypothetical protein [Candidatus Melainabacteria bacterium]
MPTTRERLRNIILGLVRPLNEKDFIAGFSIYMEGDDLLLYQFHHVKGKINFIELISDLGRAQRSVVYDTVDEAVDAALALAVKLGKPIDDVVYVTTQAINKRESVLGEGKIWVFKGRVNVSNKAVATLYGFSECVALGTAQVYAHDYAKVFAFDEVMVHIKDRASAQVFDKAQTARYL